MGDSCDRLGIFPPEARARDDDAHRSRACTRRSRPETARKRKSERCVVIECRRGRTRRRRRWMGAPMKPWARSRRCVERRSDGGEGEGERCEDALRSALKKSEETRLGASAFADARFAACGKIVNGLRETRRGGGARRGGDRQGEVDGDDHRRAIGDAGCGEGRFEGDGGVGRGGEGGEKDG